jgi:hypothetical protein
VRGHECFHCKQFIPEGVEHDCWTTTEQALTKDLSEDLRDAWERLRETAAGFGEQRVYASHHSIMFSRKACYFFVRPKRNILEVVIFLGRSIKAPQVRKAISTSRTKVAHLIHIRHRDEVEPPISEWLEEAYHLQDALPTKPKKSPVSSRSKIRSRKKARKVTAAPARSRRSRPSR